jgi:hypothetical protein
MYDRCVVLVSDYNYYQKTTETVQKLRTLGNYTDTVVLITDQASFDKVNLSFNDLLNELSITIKIFDPIDLTYILDMIKKRPFTNSIDGRELNKTIQWNKIHMFDVYFKQWKYIFYIDAGMNIYKPIEPFWDIIKQYGNDVLIAHSDTYPLFKNNFRDQYETQTYPEIFNELEKLADLSSDNFQSTIMLFHSDIINENTKKELINYANKFPISRTNEQGIMNLYFNGIHKLWEPMPVYWNGKYTYDFWNRNNLKPEDYIMLKYTR